jgi:hypothetical protein
MPHKKIRLKLKDEIITLSISGEAAKSAMGALYERLTMNSEQLTIDSAGYAAIEMFLELFGEEITEKILRYCEDEPGRAAKKFGRFIRKKVYPLAARQRKYEDRQGVKKYL